MERSQRQRRYCPSRHRSCERSGTRLSPRSEIAFSRATLLRKFNSSDLHCGRPDYICYSNFGGDDVQRTENASCGGSMKRLATGHLFPPTCATVKGSLDSRKRRPGVRNLTMADPKTTLPPTAAMRPVPAWSRVKKAIHDDGDAAFAAGAALGALDAVLAPTLPSSRARR